MVLLHPRRLRANHMSMRTWARIAAVFFLYATITLNSVQDVAANVPPIEQCLTQEFKVQFAPDSQDISPEAMQALSADIDRARPCNVWTAIVASPSLARAQAVREAMLEQGFPDALINVVELRTATGGLPAEVDAVRVTIIHR